MTHSGLGADRPFRAVFAAQSRTRVGLVRHIGKFGEHDVDNEIGSCRGGPLATASVVTRS